MDCFLNAGVEILHAVTYPPETKFKQLLQMFLGSIIRMAFETECVIRMYECLTENGP
jgi:hypothetical protein